MRLRYFLFHIAICSPVLGQLPAAAAADQEPIIRYHDPSRLDVWKKYRTQVRHPAGMFKQSDLARARENIRRHPWAAEYARKFLAEATRDAARITPEYLVNMVPEITVGDTSPCPACRDRKLRWLPNNTWLWSPDDPEKIRCRQCSTEFPNQAYPETVSLQSKWNPRQRFQFVAGPAFECFGFMSPANPAGIIRKQKLHYMFNLLGRLGFAYALSDDVTYADSARQILLRLAEVCPGYLVMSGYTYNEYADCDPREAARKLSNLPTDELIAPPQKPDRKLHTGFWSASRIGASGMDGSWLTSMATAYDLTCEARRPDGSFIYRENERIRIEKDVLLELCDLAICDNSINNKSVGNRAGCAIVGLVIGHPDLVRFGLDGFIKTVDDWFLPDGGTSESPAYAMMTMGGIRAFGYALRDYTEPPDYVPPAGSARLKNFNVWTDTDYGRGWQGLLWTLQGNLHFPPFADSYIATAIGSGFAELLTLAYPMPQSIGLMRAYSNGTPSGNAVLHSLFYREPAGDTATEPFHLPDMAFPYLAQCYLRTGTDGRSSLALLNASNWGGHHHHDSLNLYYWKDGHELLTDLGYLWDHPDQWQTQRTLAHQLVMIDGKEQLTGGRNGSIERFVAGRRIKVAQASSNAYGERHLYRRQIIQIEHGDRRSYLIDVFDAGGGEYRDYVIHGPNNTFALDGLSPTPVPVEQIAKPRFRFSPRLRIGEVGELEIADVALFRCVDGLPEKNNLVEPFPPQTPSSGLTSGWGFYQGNGIGRWQASPGISGNGVKLIAEKPIDNLVNLALQIGRSNGYTGKEAFAAENGDSYLLCYAYRANVPFSQQIMYWPEAEAGVPTMRKYLNLKQISNQPIAEKEGWMRYEGTFSFINQGASGFSARQTAAGNAPWRAVWTLAPDYRFTMHVPGAPGEEILLADDWGQRNHSNNDRGATFPYFARRRRGSQADRFVTIFEGFSTGKETVRQVNTIPLPGDATLIIIDTLAGPDVVVVNPAGKNIEYVPLKLRTDAKLAVIAGISKLQPHALLSEGTFLKMPNVHLRAPVAEYTGRIVGVKNTRTDSCFILSSPALPDAKKFSGKTLYVTTSDQIERAYPIHRIESIDSTHIKVYSRTAQVGFPAVAGEFFRLPVVLEQQELPDQIGRH